MRYPALRELDKNRFIYVQLVPSGIEEHELTVDAFCLNIKSERLFIANQLLHLLLLAAC
jgi:hypothetical protein